MNRQKDLPNASASRAQAAPRVLLIGCLVTGLTVAGCGWSGGGRPSRLSIWDVAPAEHGDTPSVSDSPAPNTQDATPLDSRAILARDDWIHAARPLGEAGVEPSWRWRYPALEDLLAGPTQRRADLKAALGDREPIVAANAAIALGRLGDASAMDELARAVRTPEMKLPIRLAAAEALGALCEPAPVGLLGELIDQYGDRGRADRNHPIPELHAELIRGLARHVDPADDPRFLDALERPAAEVRLEALQAWHAGRHGALPVEAADLRADPDPRVRAAALASLAHRRHAQARQYLTTALDDCELRVRVAAVTALGELGGSEARATLEKLLEDPAELIRAASVSALAACGAEPSVFEAKGDKSWRVRLEVARALVRYPTPRGAALARELIDDPSSVVRRRTIASLSEWPLQQAGPVLLAAMGGTGYMTRKAAAEQLALLWPPAAEFPVDGPSQRRVEMLGELESRFREQVGSVDPEVVYREVLPDCDPAFEALDRLASGDIAIRRRGAQELAELARGGPLGRLAMARLASLAVAETDQLVWQNVLTAAADDPSEPAIRLAYAATGHPSPEVRRRACEHLAAHCGPDQQHTKVLLPVLGDENPVVVRAAVRALGASGRMDDAQPLRQLLLAPNELVRLEAATALCRLGDASGPPALERLSYSDDQAVRRQVAVAMGEIGDPTFVPSLIRLLDGHQGVRAAAMEALPEVVGYDVAEAAGLPPSGFDERIERWKQWFRHREKTVGTD